MPSPAMSTVQKSELSGDISSVAIQDVGLEFLRTSYERLRLVQPREYAIMRDSLKRYGQISPATVGRALNDSRSYEIVDGFKRYGACVELSISTMKVRVLEGGIHALKAAIVNLNRSQGALHAFDEALVVASLYRDDKLNQQQIGALFGRHKSWACRRIALCEQLSEEAIEEIRLGLLGFASAREISRLPRGNQIDALACIHKHRLSSRETAQLISRLLHSPRWEHENILHLPLDILDRRTPPRTTAQMSSAAPVYAHLIDALEKTNAAIDSAQSKCHLFDAAQRGGMIAALDKSALKLSPFKALLEQDCHPSARLGNHVY